MTRPATVDPLDAVAIRVRHRELLDTLRELLAPVDREGHGPAAEDLRAVLAFLRQGLIPSARREESLLLPAPDLWEGAAFEHAFLEAEIDRLGREGADLCGAPEGEGREGARRRVRRTLWRIEAVLEVHVLREEDRAILAAALPPGAGDDRGERGP